MITDPVAQAFRPEAFRKCYLASSLLDFLRSCGPTTITGPKKKRGTLSGVPLSLFSAILCALSASALSLSSSVLSVSSVVNQLPLTCPPPA
jgi:hypothetical protein